MSYSSREVYYVGRHFEDNEPLLDFLLQNKAITTELADTWRDDIDAGEKISNLLDPKSITLEDFPELQDVDSVSGDDGMFLGYIIKQNFVSQEDFDKNVKLAQEKWKKLFDEDVDVEWVEQYY
jgi:hypothetical protein